MPSEIVVLTVEQLEVLAERLAEKLAAAKREPLLLKRRQLAERLGVSLATLDRWRKQGLPEKPGNRFVLAECEAWVAENITR